MKKLTATLMLTAGACMLAIAAFASEPAATPTFELLDTDHNGFISTEEAASCDALLTDFAKVDANQDGKLDQAEYAAFSAKVGQKG